MRKGVGAFLPYLLFFSASRDTSRSVSRYYSIFSSHPITYQRYEQGNRYTARSIRYIQGEIFSHPSISCPISLPPFSSTT